MNSPTLVFTIIVVVITIFSMLHQFSISIYDATFNLNIASVYSYFSGSTNSSHLEEETNETLFLTWTKYFGGDHKPNLRLFKKCPELKCVMTLDRSVASKSSAILFHMPDMNWNDLPPNRLADQHYVFQMLESPSMHRPDLWSSGHKDFFNATFTYRQDSTVLNSLYGVFEKLSSPLLTNDSLISADHLNEIVKNKTKLVAWFVSNCNSASGREQFVDILKKFIPVHVYGHCGSLQCKSDGPEPFVGLPLPGLRGANNCQRMLTQDYKFYLSLDNSLCRDYVTEKLYANMEKAIVVPVVLERKIVLDTTNDIETRQALNKSFIAADDFAHPKLLADYLVYLDKNQTAYMEYHEWRRKFQAFHDNGLKSSGCELCRFVKMKKESRIIDINKWWYDDAKCHKYQPPA